ncbi:transporter substrate-binding domain-containing protein [Silvanigrella paludirubra]|uniref:Transporter substrate-binding domain-containing protein n=1 Tax=Silvanigrella paludirubra TaxID=2499159 RepID=A0A6N6VZZ8_9BACT|nr:transporter substrate-binding domain-containing protein [Silvanigrella paludirubra]KAB8040986.1 transporter substrate-binding domain-containing protein [Silvanigrella paludirubra]
MKKIFMTILILNFGLNKLSFSQDLTGFTEELPGLIEVDGETIKGPVVDKVRKILKKAKLKENIKAFPWARSYEMAKRNKNYFIFPMAKNVEREKHFKFVGVLFKINTYFYQRNTSDFKITKLEDAKKLSICVVRNDIRDQFLTQQGFENLVRFADQDDSIHALIAKKCDVTICAENIEFLWKKNLKEDIKSLVKKSYLVKEISGDRYLSINKETSPEVIQKISEAMKDLKY